MKRETEHEPDQHQNPVAKAERHASLLFASSLGNEFSEKPIDENLIDVIPNDRLVAVRKVGGDPLRDFVRKLLADVLDARTDVVDHHDTA
jgi:hypothetical protein